MARRKKFKNVKVIDATGLFADRDKDTQTTVMNSKGETWLSDDAPLNLTTVAVAEAIGGEMISFGIKPQKVKKFAEYNKIPSFF
jgi:hypothetical protein